MITIVYRLIEINSNILFQNIPKYHLKIEQGCKGRNRVKHTNLLLCYISTVAVAVAQGNTCQIIRRIICFTYT